MIVPYVPKQITPDLASFNEAECLVAFGGKGLSLVKLSYKGFYVPHFVIIDAKYTFDQGPVALFSLSRLKKYSVRSSAAVSMPGMMATKLNVSYEDIPAAVQDVWDSYFSPQAVAYRLKYGISDTIGTAVIIQQMVTGQTEAFTAMTSDIHDKGKSANFLPTIEGVVGLGDVMVGGEVTPKVITSDHKYYASLRSTLKTVHDHFGASDVELALDNCGNVWTLQQRPIKYPVKVFEPVPGCGEAIASGYSIGAKSTLIAEITQHLEDVDSSKALFVSDFTPDIYPYLEKAGAILCTNGGELCHAAIVARQEGKPAISGIFSSDIAHLKGKWYINGITGAIHRVTSADDVPITTVEALEDLSTPIKDRVTLPLLNKLCDKDIIAPIDVNRLLARYYIAVDAFNKGKISNEQQYKVVNELAQVLLHYLVYSGLGESRHVYGRTSFNHASPTAFPKKDYLDLSKTMGLQPSHLVKSRSHYVSELHALDNEQVQNVLTIVKHIFLDYDWPSGYGGKRWAECVEVARRYASGELNALLFCDQVFNLKHNGGPVFGKFTWCSYADSNLGEMLDARRRGDLDQMISVLKSSSYQIQGYAYIPCKNPDYDKDLNNPVQMSDGPGGSPHQTIDLAIPFFPDIIWDIAKNDAPAAALQALLNMNLKKEAA